MTLVATRGVLLVTALRGFALGALVLAMLAGGLATDLLIARLRPAPNRPGAFRTVATVAPVLPWGAWLVAYALAYGVASRPELWAGVVAMAMPSGLGLSVLVLPPAARPGPSRTASPVARRPGAGRPSARRTSAAASGRARGVEG